MPWPARKTSAVPTPCARSLKSIRALAFHRKVAWLRSLPQIRPDAAPQTDRPRRLLGWARRNILVGAISDNSATRFSERTGVATISRQPRISGLFSGKVVLFARGE